MPGARKRASSSATSPTPIAQYNRVTIGAEEEMEAFLQVVREIMKEEGL